MNKKKGFTLIELLVVIAIIGILSSIVLASLNSARNKGSDAAVKEGLNNLRAQAELFYSNNSDSYTTSMCTTDPTFVKAAVSVQGAATAGTWQCASAASAWSASAGLKGAGGYWCVDNTGNAKAESTAPLAGATACL